MTHLDDSDWLGLVIGNSRLHWAWFSGSRLQQTWDTPHITARPVTHLPTVLDALRAIAPDTIPPALADVVAQPKPSQLPLWIVSVVADQLTYWQPYPSVYCLTASQVPIPGLYPTLGIDRAVALWGAMQQWGTPVLVIDGGTALTFTGVDAAGCLVGGAILPGLGLQGRSLHQFTATLPEVMFHAGAETLPPRWAVETETAIRSGILYTTAAGIISFIEAWRHSYPESQIVMTGGDSVMFKEMLGAIAFHQLSNVQVDPHLVFHGIAAIRHSVSG